MRILVTGAAGFIGSHLCDRLLGLGNPGGFIMKELAELVVEITGSKSDITYTGAFREDGPMRRCPDISKAKKFLDWEPTIDLKQGLGKTIADFKARLSSKT